MFKKSSIITPLPIHCTQWQSIYDNLEKAMKKIDEKNFYQNFTSIFDMIDSCVNRRK